VAASGGATRVELNRRLFEASLSALMETIAQAKTGAEADTDTESRTEVEDNIISPGYAVEPRLNRTRRGCAETV